MKKFLIGAGVAAVILSGWFIAEHQTHSQEMKVAEKMIG
ncbi:Phr family secreted Rap phosphatase inhibitor [Bacillus inaquosorum]|nr:Phr family secreted Rap phosphatase inhibitor [Bacillus inaquosorum]ARV45889.1 phosphatase [Bacillus subtilis]MCY7749239.1 Phr family secreted Rap phosphatase inhibitor [Bacillus inaquosorum]MCY7910139.1 Phr family secreted Rap phosphatase inhibitor [Bacillus inaquosorum]MCY7961503.1 Phr family secreted Rap phosphatase inhibitor [Bacillus inaquosorum]MCY8070185.1 Phr family secreted Rap phosphatase inhibitor [Bacillus inaquosorum]